MTIKKVILIIICVCFVKPLFSQDKQDSLYFKQINKYVDPLSIIAGHINIGLEVMLKKNIGIETKIGYIYRNITNLLTSYEYDPVSYKLNLYPFYPESNKCNGINFQLGLKIYSKRKNTQFGFYHGPWLLYKYMYFKDIYYSGNINDQKKLRIRGIQEGQLKNSWYWYRVEDVGRSIVGFKYICGNKKQITKKVGLDLFYGLGFRFAISTYYRKKDIFITNGWYNDPNSPEIIYNKKDNINSGFIQLYYPSIHLGINLILL